jgi:hypothetical protein
MGSTRGHCRELNNEERGRLSAGTLSGGRNSSGELAHELKDANETQEIFGAVQTATAFLNVLDYYLYTSRC